MNWYYADEGKQAGPVTQEQFDELVRSGKIQPDTLVWREGMSNWAPYRDANVTPDPTTATSVGGTGYVPGQSPEAVCGECGNMFAIKDMIRHSGVYICANCKPVFMQKLAEGAPVKTEGLRYAGFWIRFVAKFLDGLVLAVVLGVPMVILFIVFASSAAGHVAHPGFNSNFTSHASADAAGLAANFIGLFVQCGFVIAQVLYSTLFLGKYGATLGKMACGLKVVDSDGNRISYGRAFGRGCAELLSGMICDIGYIIAGFDSPQKRALHDHLCNTRVVYK